MDKDFKTAAEEEDTYANGGSPKTAALVSFATDIVPLLSEGDIGCMSGMRILLDDFAYMSDAADGSVRRCGPFPDHAHARAVYASLKGDCAPQMPFGGPFWTDTEQGRANLEKFKQWMDEGYNP